MSEHRNLFLFLISHPVFLIEFVFRSSWLLLAHLMRNKVGGSASDIWKRNVQPSLEKKATLHFERFPTFRDVNVVDIDGYGEIKLATSRVPSVLKLDWLHIFKDIEDTFSLNRFGWLLTATHAYPTVNLAHRAVGWITNWIDVMEEEFQHPAWESYSVSERLSNWPFILIAAKRIIPLDPGIEKIVVQSMELHIQYLLKNLELRGIFTNNHILNNARGLFIGGLITGNDLAIQKAKEIFYEWTPKLFHADGMSQEDSSHYQCLFSQRYEQVYFLSLSHGDEAFASFIREWTMAISKARDFFYVRDNKNQWTMPLIGDISPDFGPEWFSPLSKMGWKKVKNCYDWTNVLSLDEKITSHSGFSEINGRFLRYDDKDITVFWHVRCGTRSTCSHGHFDAGSFILFLKGKEIFADPGRCSYSVKGTGGKYAKAHSCLLVDGLGAFCEDHRLNLIDAYPYQNAGLTIATDSLGERTALSMRMDGFKRLQNPLVWARTFSINDGIMVISDKIEAKHSHEIETRFIVADGLSVEKIEEGLRIQSDDGMVMLKVVASHGIGEKSLSTEESEISREYGHAGQGIAFIVKNKITGNHVNTYEIRWYS